MAKKKPAWWTPAVKAVLIWFCGFLIWLALSPRSPRLAGLIFLISMMPLVLLYTVGIVRDWARLVAIVYKATAGSIARARRKRTSRLP